MKDNFIISLLLERGFDERKGSLTQALMLMLICYTSNNL